MLLSAVKQTPSGLLKKVLELPEGSTVGDVLRALNWQKTEEIGLSIYGRRCKEEAERLQPWWKPSTKP